MNSDRELLSFTLPAPDFGYLAEKTDVLESHWAGTSDEKLRWYACWHVFDPCTLDCVHCGCSRKWDLHENPSAAERANAALLLRLRAFFRAIDRPTPWADFADADEPDEDVSVPIRVILAPVAKLTVEFDGKSVPVTSLDLAAANRALAKPAKKELHQLADRLIADMREKFEGEVLVPLTAEAAERADRVLARTIEAATARKQAGYAMTCPAVELIKVPAAAVEPAPMFEVEEGFK